MENAYFEPRWIVLFAAEGVEVFYKGERFRKIPMSQEERQAWCSEFETRLVELKTMRSLFERIRIGEGAKLFEPCRLAIVNQFDKGGISSATLNQLSNSWIPQLRNPQTPDEFVHNFSTTGTLGNAGEIVDGWLGRIDGLSRYLCNIDRQINNDELILTVQMPISTVELGWLEVKAAMSCASGRAIPVSTGWILLALCLLFNETPLVENFKYPWLITLAILIFQTLICLSLIFLKHWQTLGLATVGAFFSLVCAIAFTGIDQKKQADPPLINRQEARQGIRAQS